MKPHRGVLILVLGILGLVACGPFTAIPAWIMGNSDMAEMAAGRMDPEGRGLTQAGKICGVIGVVLVAISIVFILMAVVGLGIFSARASH
jgi:hypothetical protein